MWALAERGEFDEAMTHGQEALRLAKEVGHPFNLAHIYYDLGYFRGVEGEFDQAVDDLEQAFALVRRRAERGHEAYALRLLGAIAAHPDLHQIETAQGHYVEALTLAETLDMRPLVAHCHLGLGRLYPREGKRQETDKHVARAATMYRDIGMRFWQKQASAME